ncbi:MAG TPA: hypothetical protein VHS96_18405 [Bacteroidia bacterium]|nr:hypothetical protein [Bacteroidia bacterium]
MKNQYFVLRAKDCFGDTWPLANRTAGIDGERHKTLESAKVVAARFKAEKEFRVSLRQRNAWQQGTIRGLEILEVYAS